MHAGLELFAAVGDLKTHAALQTRVGIRQDWWLSATLSAREVPRSKQS